MSAKTSTVWQGVGSTVLWMLCSVTMVIINKEIYRKFPYPFMVTGLSQISSCVCGYAMAKVGLLRLPPLKNAAVMAKKVAPVVISYACSLFFGNYAYVHLSVAFVQMMKAFTPAVTLVIGIMLGVERFSWTVLLAVLLIGAGTGGTFLIEQAAPAFSWIGFYSFMISSVMEAARTSMSEVLLSKEGWGTAEVLVYVGGTTGFLLLACSWVWERAGIMESGLQLLVSDSHLIVGSLLSSSLVNLFSYFSVKSTSSLTFKVAGCFKNIGAIIYGIGRHKDVVTGMQAVGYSVSLAGIGVYSWFKMNKAGKAHHKQA